MLLNQSTVVILLSVGMLSSLSLMLRVLVVLDVWMKQENFRASGARRFAFMYPTRSLQPPAIDGCSRMEQSRTAPMTSLYNLALLKTMLFY